MRSSDSIDNEAYILLKGETSTQKDTRSLKEVNKLSKIQKTL